MIIISRDADNIAERRQVEDALAERFALTLGTDVLMVPPIYQIEEDDMFWDRLAQLDQPIILLSWLYPRAAEWLLRHHHIGSSGMLAIDLRAFRNVAACIDACLPHLTPGPKQATVTDWAAGTRQRWYPIIDESRCIQCKQCVQFCLFGVYEIDEAEHVRVAHPDNCKDGCPACSRICPRGAIIFALYDQDEAIAGAPGKFPSPDQKARKMYEQRTKQKHQSSEPDDLDDLIDDLDKLTERNS
jgi:NAD-dependent dihydropyrimidine dehydrogenase PreA subunit